MGNIWKEMNQKWERDGVCFLLTVSDRAAPVAVGSLTLPSTCSSAQLQSETLGPVTSTEASLPPVPVLAPSKALILFS